MGSVTGGLAQWQLPVQAPQQPTLLFGAAAGSGCQGRPRRPQGVQDWLTPGSGVHVQTRLAGLQTCARMEELTLGIQNHIGFMGPFHC